MALSSKSVAVAARPTGSNAKAAADTETTSGRSGVATSAEAKPSFQSLKRDLPSIEDPIALINDVSHRLPNFPTAKMKEFGEMRDVIKQLRTDLKKVKRPPENRLAAERILKDLQELQKAGYPYHDSVIKIFDAAALISRKNMLNNGYLSSGGQYNHAMTLLGRYSFPEDLQKKILALEEKHISSYNFGSPSFSKSNKSLPPNWRDVLESPQAKKAFSNFNREAADEIEAFYRTPEGQRFLKDRHGYQHVRYRPGQFNSDTAPSKNISILLRNHEVILPTLRPQSIEGLAESYLIGLRPVEFPKGPKVADGQWRTQVGFANHDVAHIEATRFEREFSMAKLPPSTRISILSSVDKLAPRERELALYSVFDAAHEVSPLFFKGNGAATDETTIAMIRQNYSFNTGKNLSEAEARWLATWFYDNIKKPMSARN